jgi:hypothetical protein
VSRRGPLGPTRPNFSELQCICDEAADLVAEALMSGYRPADSPPTLLCEDEGRPLLQAARAGSQDARARLRGEVIRLLEHGVEIPPLVRTFLSEALRSEDLNQAFGGEARGGRPREDWRRLWNAKIVRYLLMSYGDADHVTAYKKAAPILGYTSWQALQNNCEEHLNVALPRDYDIVMIAAQAVAACGFFLDNWKIDSM